jgi:hypothetical protein
MSSSRRINLPLLPSLDASQRPTLERARKQLGGAGETTGFAGTVVRVPNRDDTWSVGVALYASADEVDVWLDGSRVRRARADEVHALPRDHDPALHAVIADVQVFASLHRGDAVRWQEGDGRTEEGTLIEKCRYGALVATPEGRVLAVGFRRLWPVPAGVD